MNYTFSHRTITNSGRLFPVLSVFCLVLIFISVSCTNRMWPERSLQIRGYWRTDKDIIMSIRMSDEHGLAAFIYIAPGFLSEETRPGTVIISQIKPLVDGGFSGLFIMPGELEPVKVRLLVSSGSILRIVTWDRRAKGNIMQWTRIEEPR